MGLDKFSKQQRRNPDQAKCWSCMREQEAADPDYRGAGGDSDGDGGDDGDDDDVDDDDYDSDNTLDHGDATTNADDASLAGETENLSVSDNADSANSWTASNLDSWTSGPSSARASSSASGGVAVGSSTEGDGWGEPVSRRRVA
ncbi:hypothetical protein LTS18_009434 [Coniosporium uncinatum]|uniref:Uncharacterized protein n=1 Tax=Coniosporium uncinatum TaxID=93489 RepID=A0ACC3D113_9PEZI|nr:hypothetical protein LTS18_009434 [Coniosporium uncinatum]